MSKSLCNALVLVSIITSPSQLSAAPNTIPNFNIERSCRSELAGGSPIGETMDSCRADEERARDELTPRWSLFSQTDKTICIRETQIDGSPSYVELETCLEMTPSGRQDR